MPQTCSILIAPADLMQALKARAGEPHGELLTFLDSDALHALDVITRRHPAFVTIERTFAATPRGAALIERIKADPALSQSEVRVLSHDGDPVRPAPAWTQGDAGAATAVVEAPAPAIVDAPTELDQHGTRRAPRFKIVPPVDALIDGNTVTLVDLSTVGAQVISPTILKPNQRIRMTLTDDRGSVRLSGAVAWASFEVVPSVGPRYRAGIEFLGADPAAVDEYCARHRE